MSSGRVSGVTAEVANAFAARYNPALIAAQSLPLFGFSVAAAGAHYSPLSGVLVDSPRYRTQDAIPRTQDFQLPDMAVTTWAVGGTYPFFLPHFLGDRSAGFGFTFSGPMGQLHQISATTPYDFNSLHYGVSDSQLKATISASVELIPQHLFLGGGVNFYLASSGAADAQLATDNPTGRMQVDVGLNTAAVAGLFAQAGDNAFSLVYHQEIVPPFEQVMNAKVQFGGRGAFQLPFAARTVFYYEPHLFEADFQHDFGLVTASFGASYQLWSHFRPAFLAIVTEDSNGKVISTSVPQLSMSNTWNPRASLQLPLWQKHVLLAAGYEYRPSPVQEISGATNLLDTNTHVAGLSLQYQLHPGELFSTAVRVGVFGQYHWLTSRTITKSSAEFIGSPSYTVSGHAQLYGASIEAEL